MKALAPQLTRVEETSASARETLEAGKWFDPWPIGRSIYLTTRFLRDGLGCDVTRPLPEKIPRISAAKLKQWLSEQKFSMESDFLLERPLNSNINPEDFEKAMRRAIGALGCTFGPASQFYTLTGSDVSRMGSFAMTVVDVSNTKAARYACIPGTSIYVFLEKHHYHHINGKSCCRITFIFDGFVMVMDCCRRQLCFMPPLAFGEENELLNLFRLVIKPDRKCDDWLQNKTAEEAIRKAASQSEKTSSFRICTGIREVRTRIPSNTLFFE
jgi:hypothetical protein